MADKIALKGNNVFNVKGQPFDGDGGGGDDGGMNERVAALEAKWEAVIPTLSTKADIAQVGTDIQKASGDLVKWIIGTAFAGVAVFITVMTFVLNNAVPKAPAAPPQPTVIVVPAATPATVAHPATPATPPK